MADVQIAVIDTIENEVNVAVPGVQGPIGLTGSVAIAQAGTAAEPGIRFESDTNTGIYSPGADQVAISTNGTGRLFVDASGNVGIGTATPQSDVVIRASTPQLTFEPISDAQDCRIQFALADGTLQSTIRSGGALGKAIAFYDGQTFTERMRLDSSGRLGLGTSSPSTPLEVAAAGSQTDFITLFGSRNSADTQVGILFKDRNADPGGQNAARIYSERQGSSQAYSFKIATANTDTLTDRVTVQNTGNVGIGTTSPSSLLHLADAGHITVGTTTGTKIGTATTQKLGFYNATPVVQPAAVADATDAVDVITQLNDLLAKLRTLGIIAT
jgi:hypothetical protein